MTLAGPQADLRAAPAAARRAWTATVTINGKPVRVECTRSAAQRLAERAQPLVLELDLFFSCLVKKQVRVHDAAPSGRETVRVTDRLELYFRAVTSTACSMELAERLGGQPETEIDTPVTRRFAPKRARLDVVRGEWQAAFWM
ncbi:MAG: hypothetical protein ABT20_01755 [Rubrivivax sp. SCN 70-15]|nr:MAG: hypothetical protein ABT20_01755 [Rubrivivax sp. SCN 70-15]